VKYQVIHPSETTGKVIIYNPKLAEGILNKQLLTSDAPPSWRFGNETLSVNNLLVTTCYAGLWTWADFLERSKQRKIDVIFVTNVRSSCSSG
jgi:hypothetical protein